MTTHMRDGSVAQDPRLGRLERFDSRSRNYPVLATFDARQPRSYTWRCHDHYDQRNEGACVSFAWGHEAAARPAEVRGHSFEWLIQRYHDAQRDDEWPGGSYPGASPQYAGTSVLAGAKVYRALGYFREFRWAFGVDELVLGVGYHGPAVIGIAWYSGMFSPDAQGFIRPSGSVAGGHSILVRAIDARRGVLTLRNSWGRDWGRDGDCYISVEDMGRLLREDGEACFAARRTSRP